MNKLVAKLEVIKVKRLLDNVCLHILKERSSKIYMVDRKGLLEVLNIASNFLAYEFNPNDNMHIDSKEYCIWFENNKMFIES